jgi:hypothetical protein
MKNAQPLRSDSAGRMIEPQTSGRRSATSSTMMPSKNVPRRDSALSPPYKVMRAPFGNLIVSSDSWMLTPGMEPANRLR